jgi:hypothetical protein
VSDDDRQAMADADELAKMHETGKYESESLAEVVARHVRRLVARVGELEVERDRLRDRLRGLLDTGVAPEYPDSAASAWDAACARAAELLGGQS